MGLQQAATETAVSSDLHNRAGTRLRGRWLTITRATWVVITALALCIFIASILTRMEKFGIPSPPRHWTESDLLAALAELGLSPMFYVVYNLLFAYALFLGPFIIAAVIFWRRSDDRMALFVSLTLVTWPISAITFDLLLSTHPAWRLPIGFVSAVGTILFQLFFFLFPDGQFVPRWTRALAVVWIAWIVPSPFLPTSPYHSPTWPPLLASLVVLGWLSAGAYAQVYRYRHVSSFMQRQQTKWVMLGSMAALVGILASGLFALLGDPSAGARGLLYQLASVFFYTVPWLLVPLFIAISILRYQLWDIDLIINRTLVYIPLTAILAGLFAASIIFLQKLFVALTGDKSDAAIVLTTLILVSATTPIKTALQTLVDKRFKEAPDPTRRLKAFGEQVRSGIWVISIEQATRRLLDEAALAFQAEGGAVYLKQDGKLQLVHTCGEWNDDAKMNVPLESNDAHLGLLSLGMRRSGSDYTPQDREVLQQTVGLLVRAIGPAGHANTK